MSVFNQSFRANKKGEFPFEYLKGKVVFLNCKIDLSKRTFIPRIETEFWLGKAIKEINNKKRKNLKILDIFAGSGCIGVAVLKNCRNLCQSVDFVEIDQKAISQIRLNLKLNKVPKSKYNIYKSNLFEKLKNKNYDYIFANPPYVALNRIKEVGASVLKYEPKSALFGGKDGLFYIREFLNKAENFLKKEGIIYLEIDSLQIKEIIEILKRNNFKKFNFFKDQFKKYRWVKIWT